MEEELDIQIQRCARPGGQYAQKPMKRRVSKSVSCLCFSLILIALPSPVRAAGAENATKPKVYDESADGDKQVAEATAIARRDHKHILLQFGANWCGWCLKLHKLFETDKSIHLELSTNYVLVLIDVNQGHNKGFAAKYGADNHGIPFLAVLDADGKSLTTKETDDLEEGDHHSPQKVLDFLKAWEPGAVTGSSVGFAPNPKVTFVGFDGSDGGLKRAYFKAENSGPSEIICRVHVEQRGGGETANFSVPAGGSTPFSFFVRPEDAPKITAEVLRLVPVSRFTVPLPNEAGAGNRSRPVGQPTNSTPAAAGSGG